MKEFCLEIMLEEIASNYATLLQHCRKCAQFSEATGLQHICKEPKLFFKHSLVRKRRVIFRPCNYEREIPKRQVHCNSGQ